MKKFLVMLVMLVGVFAMTGCGSRAVLSAISLKTRVLWLRSWMNLKIWMD